MPDKDGQLTKEEKQAAIDWLEKKAPSMACPACGQRNFIIGDHAVSSMVQTGEGIAIGGTTYPQILVTCTNCSHTFHFNAVMIGIITDEAKGKEGEDQKKEVEKKEGGKADG